MLLEDIGMTEIYYEVLKEYVIPASVFAFQLEGRGWDDMVTEDFLAKYTPNAGYHLVTTITLLLHLLHYLILMSTREVELIFHIRRNLSRKSKVMLASILEISPISMVQEQPHPERDISSSRL